VHDLHDFHSVAFRAAQRYGVAHENRHHAREPGAAKELNAFTTYSINALGPLRVTGALLPQLREGTTKKVLHLTSGMGSIGDNTSGGAYGYRMSKAALNMGNRSMAIDLKRDGIHAAVINPGWVKTDMGGEGAPVAVAESAAGILAQLDALSAKISGGFLDYSGKQWPW